MKNAVEANVWQIAGGAVTVAGGAVLLYAFLHFGFASAEQSAITVGVVASFLLLIGITTFCAGRALHVELVPMARVEVLLWRTLTIVCFAGGLALVGFSVINEDTYLGWLASFLAGAFSIVAGVVFTIAQRLAYAQQELVEQKREVVKQQQLAESLLLNTLPAEIAAELKEKGFVGPRYHEDVTVLFTDFQGFTLSTEKLPAEELVRALHGYFSAFDAVIQTYGLEKLKTIGDSYMCVAGLPQRKPSHAVDAVLAAFGILQEVVRGHGNGLPPWSIRIGVHTGPVVSGVVGIRKFAFDIWGESVNFASRIESSGHPDRINLSASTYARVKDFFECEPRGKVRTKEGREFDMYFALRPLDSLAPAAFAARYQSYFGGPLPEGPTLDLRPRS